MIKSNYFKKNFFLYSYIKNFFLVIFFLFVIYKINQNIKFFEEKILVNLSLVLTIFLIYIIHHNFVNLRLYVLFKMCTQYSGSFFHFAKTYFESMMFNILLSHTGSAHRSIELKKKKVKYSQFLGLFYISYFGYLIINILLFNLEIFFIDDISDKFKLSALSIFLIIFICSILLPAISKTLLSKFQFIKLEFINKIFNFSLIVFDFIKSNALKTKAILIMIVFISISHCLEFLVFYFSYDLFINNVKIKTLMIMFSISFILDRTPIVANIPGLNETIFATISVPMGLYFNESFFIKLTQRFMTYFSVIINFLFFKYFKKK